MKTLIIYDSLYGNTKEIAQAIGSAFPKSEVKLINVAEASLEDLEAIQLLIVGSPTHGGRPKPEMQKFLDQIPTKTLNNIKIAAFDTRFLDSDLNFAMKLLIRTFGYASPRILDILKSKGGKPVVSPEGFIVTGKEGPLKQGEIERAKSWADEITHLAASIIL